VALLAALPIRAWAAVSDQGLFWPDEIYQSLEQAHRVAFGTGLVPWEFEKGARSWLFPGLIAGFWKVLAAVGVRDTLTLIVLAKLMVVAVGLVGIAASMRLAHRLGGLPAALLAGGLCAAYPPMVVYGARCMTETVSGPLVVLAALLVLEGGPKKAAWAGALAGLAVFFRYQNGLVVVGLLAMLLWARRWADARPYVLAAGVVGLLGGALDWVTWGGPFHAFIEYVKFNLVEGKASNWGTSAPAFYVQTAWTAAPGMSLLAGVGLLWSWTRSRGLVAMSLAYVVAHVLIPHKEFRFLMPILPLALALAGVGLAELVGQLKVPSSGVAVAAVLLLPWGYQDALAETFGTMGQYLDTQNKLRSVWHADEDQNRALLQAAARQDVCGMVILGVHPAWMGGYTYLDHDVGFYFRGTTQELQGANYVVAPAQARLPAPYALLVTTGTFGLFKRPGECTPKPPGWKPILP
jgi:hypothetical protein